MPRQTRHIEPNGFYHVISQSVNQTWVFRDRTDFACFRGLVKEAKERFPVQLYHYVFMNTHFHFVLQAVAKNVLSRHLSFVKWNYTLWMRRKYGWRGPLWRERFKSLLIANEVYLAACGLYVEYNPVKAGLCHEATDYPYSSARKYFKGEPDDLVDEYSVPTLPIGLQDLAKQPVVSDAFFSRCSVIGRKGEKGDSHLGDCHL